MPFFVAARATTPWKHSSAAWLDRRSAEPPCSHHFPSSPCAFDPWTWCDDCDCWVGSSAAVGFDWDSSQRSADGLVKCASADCSSTSCSSCATCCESDEIAAIGPVGTVASSSCREVPAIRKAMNGCELRTDDVGASLHEEFPLSCPFPSSTFLRSDSYCGFY